MRLPSTRRLFGLVKKLDEPAAIALIRHGIDQGINYIDTAYGYHGGKSEIVVGKALQGGYREKVHLVTKLPMWKVKEQGDVFRLLREQLRKLQADHLDVYLCHAMNKKHFATLQRLDLMKPLEEAKASGLIKHVGFSFHDTWPVFKEIVDYHPGWDVVQIQYNYMDTGIQATTKGLEYAASKGIAVVIMEPLKGGRLANPPQAVLDIFNGAPVKRTPVDWALQFLWNRPEVSCVLSGMSSRQQVDENLASASASGVGTLAAAETGILETVAGIFERAILVPCTACEYCMPCPSGVAIPRVFALLNDASRAGSTTQAVKGYKKLARDRKALNAARDNGMGSLCSQCNACIEKCPQGIDVPSMLEKAHAVLGTGVPLDQAFPGKSS